MVAFHDGRGSQEGIFAELKSQLTLGYVPNNTWNANKACLLSNFMAHNLDRELQMRYTPEKTKSGEKRPTRWQFIKLDTFRRMVIQRAGKLIQPQGKLTLSMPKNPIFQEKINAYLGFTQVPVI